MPWNCFQSFALNSRRYVWNRSNVGEQQSTCLRHVRSTVELVAKWHCCRSARCGIGKLSHFISTISTARSRLGVTTHLYAIAHHSTLPLITLLTDVVIGYCWNKCVGVTHDHVLLASQSICWLSRSQTTGALTSFFVAWLVNPDFQLFLNRQFDPSTRTCLFFIQEY